jgi:energy-coupling factor transporter transmembrane protein EcfT
MTGRYHISTIQNTASRGLIGSLGHLVIFLWSLVVVILNQLQTSFWPGGICLLIIALLYFRSLKHILRPRWLILLMGLLMVSILFGGGEPDRTLWGIEFSSQAASAGVRMVMSALIIFLASDGLATSIEISEIAGIFERFGLQGLGFSLGVAVNQLPNLRQSSMHAWHSLRMRGGFRARWWRGIQLLVLTIITNALRHAEDIILAAEARAFRSEVKRSIPLRIGRLDWWIIPVGVALTLGLFLAF